MESASQRLELLFRVIALLLAAAPLLDAEQGVLPPGEASFDPKPLMDKVAERVATDKFRFVVMGDSKHSKLLPGLLEYMDERVKPDFVIFTGDIVDNGAQKRGITEYHRLAREIGPEMRKRPWWFAIGNHELGKDPQSGADHFRQFFNLSSSYYSFTFRNAVFLALPDSRLTPEEEAWLTQALENASAVHKLIFVFNHVPFYTVGTKGADSVPNQPTAITRLFDRYHTLAVFSGHDHIYYDTVRGGIPYIVSAGAGARTHELRRRGEARDGDVYYGIDPATHQFTLHQVNGNEKSYPKQQVFLNVVDVDGDCVICTCYNAAGEKWDERKLK